MFNDIRGDVTSGSDSLLQAIQKREFKPYIQPIVCASNHKIIGGELLVRWHTSHRGVIYPDSFIAVSYTHLRTQQIRLLTSVRFLNHI